MPLRERQALKSFFKSGTRPSEGNFEDLIDSCINKIDDGFSKSADQGLQLAPADGGTLASFFKNTQAIKSQIPSWSVNIDAENKGLSFGEVVNMKSVSRLFLKEGGNVGIGTTNPAYPLEVNGMAGMQGVVGTYLNSSQLKPLPADGNWQVLIKGLEGINAFEVLAAAGGKTGSGKYSAMHAVVLSTFGKSKSAINKTVARYGPFWHRLELRWTGTLHQYNLEIRTKCNFGEGAAIKYHVKKLWDNSF